MKLLAPQTERASQAGLPSWASATLHPAFQSSIAALELVIGLLLVSRWWRAGLEASLGLACAFLVYALALQESGFGVESCGCFGSYFVAPRAHVLFVLGLACSSAGAAWYSSYGVAHRAALREQEGTARSGVRCRTPCDHSSGTTRRQDESPSESTTSSVPLARRPSGDSASNR